MASLVDLSNLSINTNPYFYDTSYSGVVYAFYGAGGYTMDQCFNTIKLLPETKLYQYDVTQAIQVLFDVRTFNEKLGLYKDGSNQSILNSTFDISADRFAYDTITISSNDFVNGMTAPQVLTVGTYNSVYSDYTEFVNTYFGYAGGFSSLFADASEFNVNNGVFDANAFIYLLNQSNDPSGANVKPITGTITISNINQLLRFAIDSNVFNNRTPGTATIYDSNNNIVQPGTTINNNDYITSTTAGSNTASDICGNTTGILQNLYRSNYGTADGFISGDLFFIPAGTTVQLHLVIDAELYNPINNIGSTNIINLITSQDFTNKYNTSSSQFFTETSTANNTNIDRILTAPLLIKLANLSDLSNKVYNNLYITSNNIPTDIYMPSLSNTQYTGGAYTV